jgi:NAD(P)-dependent dehydrogenase (short-subunit alcohol dehydrogenase family)
MRLEGKVALMTGGTSGIGRATAILFAREGAVEETVRAFGSLDILFNNAGVWHPNTVPECTEEEWDRTIDINLKGTFLMCKYALPGMIARKSGVIINNSSDWGVVGGEAAASYCASKGGVVLLTKAMAVDHGRQGIRINCICPGDVDTPMERNDARARGMTWEEYLPSVSDRPMGRVGIPDEIARAALFLASDDSSFMTGATIIVDGGSTAA